MKKYAHISKIVDQAVYLITRSPAMDPKVAIIDLGTNTFHLLLAEASEKRYNITLRDRLAVKIGKGGINQGIITEDGLQRALVAMQSFKNTCDNNQVKKIYAFGTSALRNATNSSEVISRIHSLTGIAVNIISGDEEADLIYEGVRSSLGMGDEKSLIIDIGGGSVEFIIGDSQKAYWKQSFEIGAQRLVERYQKSDPISPHEIESLNLHFKETLDALFQTLKQYAVPTIIGSSGSFDTLSDIFCAQHGIHKHPEEIETPLTISGFFEIYNQLITMDRSERILMPGMINMRVDMIVVACCLIKFILDNHQFTRMRVSAYSLKEGVLARLITELNHSIKS